MPLYIDIVCGRVHALAREKQDEFLSSLVPGLDILKVCGHNSYPRVAALNMVHAVTKSEEYMCVCVYALCM